MGCWSSQPVVEAASQLAKLRAQSSSNHTNSVGPRQPAPTPAPAVAGAGTPLLVPALQVQDVIVSGATQSPASSGPQAVQEAKSLSHDTPPARWSPALTADNVVAVRKRGSLQQQPSINMSALGAMPEAGPGPTAHQDAGSSGSHAPPAMPTHEAIMRQLDELEQKLVSRGVSPANSRGASLRKITVPKAPSREALTVRTISGQQQQGSPSQTGTGASPAPK